MRHVFPTSEISHKWAHQTQSDARNPQGSLYFRGDTLYSYRDSYPIAKLFRKRGAVLALHVENTYSATTAGHCSGARRATSHLTSITVPDVRPDDKWSKGGHAQNIAYLIKEAAEYLAKAQRAMTAANVGWRRTAAAERLADAQAYSTFFGIRRKVPAFPAAAWDAALQRAERIENPDPVRDAKRFKLREQRAAQSEAVTEYRQAMMESMKAAGHGYIGYRAHIGARWQKALARLVGKKGEPFFYDMVKRTAWRLGEKQYFRSDPVMLRVNGEEIETSAGARIPLAAAPMVWERVKRALGVGYTPAGLSAVKIGDYPLTEITAAGELVAGCHRIPHSELRSMARQLGLQ